MRENEEATSAGDPLEEPGAGRDTGAHPASQSFAQRLLGGVVIVGSILLAFGIDAAWEERGETIRENEVLRSIFVDMETNLELIRDHIAITDSSLARSVHFLEGTPEELSATSSEFAETSLMAPMFDLGGERTPPEEALAALRRDQRFVNRVYRHLVVRSITAEKLRRLRASTERSMGLLGP